MRRIRFLIWKELIELRQDPRLLGIVVMAPILQLFMLGYAATTDVATSRSSSPTCDRSVDEPGAGRPLRRVAKFHRRRRGPGLNEVDRYLESGTAWMALAIPAGYGERAGGRAAADGAGDCRRQRRELGRRGARLRDER